MSTTVRELLVALGVKADTAGVRRFDQAVGSTKRTMGAAVGAARRLTGGLKGLVAGYLGFQAAVGAGRGVVEANVEYERLHASLQTIEGSVGGADAAFAKLAERASSTPFTLQEVTGGFVKLKNMGLDPSERAMTAYGNTAASMGKSLDQMVEAVADAATGEFERLKEFGIKASKQGEKVTFTFKGIKTTVKNDSAEIEKYIQGIGLTDFAGAMDRQMGTLGGRFSNFKDTLFQLLIAVGQAGLSDAIKEITGLLIDGMGEADGFAKKLGTALGDVMRLGVDVLKFLMSRAGTLFSFAKQIFAVVGPLVAPVLGVLGQVAGIGDRIIGALLPLALGLLQRLLPLAVGILGRVVALVDSIAAHALPIVVGLVERLIPIIAKLAPVVEGVIAGVLPIVDQVAAAVLPIIATIAGLIGSQLGPGLGRASAIIAAIMPIVEKLGAFVVEVFDDLGPLIEETLGELLTLSLEIADALLPLVVLFFGLVLDNLDTLLPATKFILRALLFGTKNTLGIMTTAVRALGAVIGWIAEIGAKVSTKMSTEWDRFAAPIIAWWDTFTAAIARAVSFVATVLQPVADFVDRLIGKIQEVKDSAGSVTGWFGELGNSALGAVGFGGGDAPAKGKAAAAANVNQKNSNVINIYAAPGTDTKGLAGHAGSAVNDSNERARREALAAFDFGGG